MGSRSYPYGISLWIVFFHFLTWAGAVRIGALFPIFGGEGTGFALDDAGVDEFAGFLMALHEINASSTILPNTPIYFSFQNSRRDSRSAFFGATYLASDAFGESGVNVVIGPSDSDAAISVQQALLHYPLVQISHAATDPSLSNDISYPYFFRTPPSDAFQGQGQAEVVDAFGWGRVATIASTDTYGSFGIDAFQSRAKELGIELLVTRSVSNNQEDVSQELQAIKDAEARIIVMFCQASDAANILETGYSMGIVGPGFQWIGCDATTQTSMFSLFSAEADVDAIMRGYLGLRPSSSGGALYDSMVERWVQQPCTGGDSCASGCSNAQDDDGHYIWLHDHDEDPETADVCAGFTYTEELNTYTPYAYDATYALAYALHDLIEVEGKTQIIGAELKETLLLTDFEGVTGRVKFDSAGDRVLGVVYDVMNYNASETLDLVGSWEYDVGYAACDSSVDASCHEVVYSTVDNSVPLDTVPETAFVNLGALFPFYVLTSVNGSSSYAVDSAGTERFAAFLMALDDINSDSSILPHTELRYSVRDSRRDSYFTFAAASFFVSDAFSGRGAHAVVGAASSSPSMAAQSALAGASIPQISYSATSAELSDTSLYPYFFRTPPSDALQGLGQAEIVQEFGWVHVAAVHTTDSYGSAGIASFSAAAAELGMDVITVVPVTTDENGDLDFRGAIQALKDVGARIIVMFADQKSGATLLEVGYEQGLGGEGFQWIGCDATTQPPVWEDYMESDEIESIMRGYIGLVPSVPPSTMLDDFVERWAAQPCTGGSECELGCSDARDDDNQYAWWRDHDDNVETPDVCSGISFSENFNVYVPFAYDAVFAVSYALHSLIEEDGKTEIIGAELKERLQSVQFYGLTGLVKFDVAGDRVASLYEVMNHDGTTLNSIGTWDSEYHFEACNISVSGCAEPVFSTGSDPPLDQLPQTAILDLGGLFPLYSSGEWNRAGAHALAAFQLAIGEINSRSDILPDSQLRYAVRDTQDRASEAVARAGDLRKDVFGSSGVVAVVGPSSNDAAESVTVELAEDAILAMSYGATRSSLSDATRYPYFFRTIPALSYQVNVLEDLIIWNEWKKIVLFYSTNYEAEFEAFMASTSVDVIEQQFRMIQSEDSEPHSGVDFDDIFETGVLVMVIMSEVDEAAALLRDFEDALDGDNYEYQFLGLSSLVNLTSSLGHHAHFANGMFVVDALPYANNNYNSFDSSWLNMPCTGAQDCVGSSCSCECSYQADDDGSLIWYNEDDFTCAGFVATDTIEEAALYAYDATYAIAYALHRLVVLEGRESVIGAELKEAVQTIDPFVGLTGTVDFDVDGTRIGNVSYTILNYGRSSADSVDYTMNKIGTWSGSRSTADITLCSDTDPDCGILTFVTGASAPGRDWRGCNPGWSNASQAGCVPCDQASYADEWDSQACKACPDNSYRDFGSSGTNKTECACRPGYYHIPFDENGKPCDPCPEGGVCDGGNVEIRAAPGYWSNRIVYDEFVKCKPTLKCAGNFTCSAGYTGRLCNKCEDGYFAVGDLCYQCPGGRDNYSINLIFTVGLIPVVLLSWVTLNMFAAGRFDAIDILLMYLQVAGMISKFALDWPDNLNNVFSVIQVVNFDVDYISPQCVMNWSYTSSFLLQIVMPPMIAICQVIWFLFRLWRKKYGGPQQTPEQLRQFSKHAWDEGVNNWLTLLNITYHTATQKVLKVFVCIPYGGETWLLHDPDIACWSDEHASIIAVGVLGLLMFSVGLPVLYFFILRNGLQKGWLSEESYLVKFRFLYARYQSDFFWWQMVFTSRRFLFSAITVLLWQVPIVQVGLGLLVIISNLALHYYSKPFLKKRLNILEDVCLYSLFIFLYFGILFYDESFTRTKLVSSLTVLLLGCTLIAGVMTSYYNIQEGVHGMIAARKIEATRTQLQQSKLLEGDATQAEEVGGELHKTIIGTKLYIWAQRDLDMLTVRMFNRLDKWLESSVADDSPTSTYQHSSIARFYRQLATNLPWLVDWVCALDEKEFERMRPLMVSLCTFYGKREKHRYASLIVEEDLSSVLYHLINESSASQRRELSQLFDMILDADTAHRGMRRVMTNVSMLSNISATVSPAMQHFEKHGSSSSSPWLAARFGSDTVANGHGGTAALRGGERKDGGPGKRGSSRDVAGNGNGNGIGNGHHHHHTPGGSSTSLLHQSHPRESSSSAADRKPPKKARSMARLEDRVLKHSASEISPYSEPVFSLDV
eukprot:Rmarinus@m.7904